MAITLGSATAPNVITQYLDDIFSTSLANYNKGLVDQISSANPFFHKLIKGDAYQGEDGGTDFRVPLMYQVASMDSYDGYDELSAVPTDGFTQAVYEWRQLAVPVVYNMREVIQNAHKIVDFVQSKIQQAELGIQDGFATQLLQGSGDGALTTPKVSAANGSYGIEPLPRLIADAPTATDSPGAIPQGTYSWWRNQTADSSATTMTGLLQEVDHMYNLCALKVGGPPDLLLCDQTTYELLVQAIYMKYRQTGVDNTFPFENTKFKKALIVFDEKVPDSYTGVTSTATKGTIYFINTKFFKLKYINGRDFAMLKDENGKSFAKPINGDSRVGHIAWMGNLVCSNRAKQGVLANIARTLTAS